MRNNSPVLEEIFNGLKALFKNYGFQGIWSFVNSAGSKTLNTFYYNFIDLNQKCIDIKLNKNTIENEINNFSIEHGHGIEGWAFKELSKKIDAFPILFISNVFEDPRNISFFLDFIIQQKQVFYVLIKSEGNFLGLLNVFFNNKNDFDEAEIINIETKIKNLLIKHSLALPLIFKNKQLGFELRNLQKPFLSHNSSEKVLEDTLASIIELNKSLQKTLMVILEEIELPISPKSIGIDLEAIISFVKSEMQFCSLINPHPDKCPLCSFPVETADDSECIYSRFLREFFYKIFSYSNSYKKEKVSLTSEFQVVYYYEKAKIDFTNISVIEIEKKIEVLNTAFSTEVSKLSLSKLRNEFFLREINDYISDINGNTKNIKAYYVVQIIEDISFRFIPPGNPCLRFRPDEHRSLIAPSTLLPLIEAVKQKVPLNFLKNFIPYIVHNDDLIIDIDTTNKKILISKDKPDKEDIKFYYEPKEINRIIEFKILDTNRYKELLSEYFLSEYSGLKNGETSILRYINSKSLQEYDPGFEEYRLQYLTNDNNIARKIKENKTISQYIKSHLAYYHSIVTKQEALRSAVRAAISQVMARNMRHNIGSHVLNNLTESNSLSNVGLLKKIFKENSYNGLDYSVENINYNDIKTKINSYFNKIADTYNDLTDYNSIANQLLEDIDFKTILNKIELIYPKGVELQPTTQNAYFNNYLNSRMDYLSEVTFGVATMQTSKKLYSEVFKELDKVRLLLNHISGITDFHYSILFQFNNSDINENNDISVAFPSDVVGCQAFYNIIENIIRNTAKHCQKKTDKTIFTINFKDNLEIDGNITKENPLLYYCVEITDGIKIKGTAEKLIKDEMKVYCNYLNKKETEIKWDKIAKIDWLVHNQNIKLNQSVLGSNNQLRTNSLGLLEMEASAAFLRQIDMPEIESDDYQIYSNGLIYNKKSKNLNIIKAFKAGNEASGYSLGYRIFLSKPQEMLFVGDWNLSEKNVEDTKIKSTLLNHGIWFKTEDDLLIELEHKTIYNHQFVLFDGEPKLEKLKKLFDYTNRGIDITDLKTSLPIRLINVSNQKSEICDILIKCDTEILKKKIWEIWGIEINPNNNKIYVFNDCNPDKPKDDFQIIIFDHLEDKKLWKKCSDFKHDGYKIRMEALSSNGQSKLPNLQNSNPGYFKNYHFSIREDNCCKIKLFEAYFNKIIVIDERIQNFSDQIYQDGVTNFMIFSESNVFLPEKTKIDLEKKNYDDDLIGLINSFIDKNIEDSKFLLIHYGILERMYKDKEESEILSKLNAWSHFVRVVVTSGRGKQSLNLPLGICYLNLSSVLYAFIENRNKFSINYILNQARK